MNGFRQNAKFDLTGSIPSKSLATSMNKFSGLTCMIKIPFEFFCTRLDCVTRYSYVTCQTNTEFQAPFRYYRWGMVPQWHALESTYLLQRIKKTIEIFWYQTERTAGTCLLHSRPMWRIWCWSIHYLSSYFENIPLNIQVWLSQCSLSHNFINLNGLHHVSFFNRAAGYVSDASQTVPLINRNFSWYYRIRNLVRGEETMTQIFMIWDNKCLSGGSRYAYVDWITLTQNGL